jgi:hypothetical protein
MIRAYLGINLEQEKNDMIHHKGKSLPWLGLAIVLLVLMPAASLADTPPTFHLQALPPLPDPGVFPVQLVLDDDSAEGVFGFFGTTARQFLCFNQFANPGPFTLEEIWVLFPSNENVPLGGDVQLVVYLDADGDPSNGANLLATYDETIQATDGNTFSVYPLSPPLEVDAAGDVLIGVINRFFKTGVTSPPTQPAALDTTMSQNRSWFALWDGDPPDPPQLATADVVDVLDGAVSGNFMIRGFGSPLAVPIGGLIVPVNRVELFAPWMGLVTIAGLVALGVALVTRRRG